jgi:hypothetical protein
MATCALGHESIATDYCDECGAPIGAAGSPGSPGGSASAGASIGGGEQCPDCGTTRVGRFCEMCGRDLGVDGSPVSPTVPVSAVSPGRPAAVPASVILNGRPNAWRVVARADRVYHANVSAWAARNAEAVAFPTSCPDRQFPLDASQLLIGRRSRSRSIEPSIDLSGPPEDPGISHAHALIVATPDGWSIVDLDSANGTYLNAADTSIEAHQPVPLNDGDQIHLGSWTTLTLHSL